MGVSGKSGTPFRLSASRQKKSPTWRSNPSLKAQSSTQTSAQENNFCNAEIKILLIEDNHADYVLTKEMLSELSCPCITKATPFLLERVDRLSAACARLQKEHFDVVLLDLSLPDAAGLDGVRQIQKLFPGVPIILLTGTNDLELAAQAIETGTDDYLVKGQVDSNILARSVLYACERRRRAEERERLESQLRHAQKLESLGVLAGGIAHDFNNLLTGILANASLARGSLKDTVLVDQRLERIERASKQAASFIHQLLAYTGKGKVSVESVDISKLVTDMSELLDKTISRKVKLHVDCAAKELFADGDENQLRQIVMNLVTNASDAAGQQQGNIWIRTGVTHAEEALFARSLVRENEAPPGDYVFFEVRDDGMGMSAETVAKIFDPFYSTKFTGRGLGLAAVLGIVRSHRGLITVDSVPGKGTTFFVAFPQAQASGKFHKVDFSIKSISIPKNLTVLVVDDEESVRTVAEEMLTSFGFSVLIAKNGTEGIALFKQQAERISAVLLDLTMPDIGGEEVRKCLRKICNRVPIIVSSGYSEHHVASSCDETSAWHFIQKPYGPTDLVQKICNAIEAEK